MTQAHARAMLTILAVTACTTQPSEPKAHHGDIIYVVGESPVIIVVDPRAGRVLAQPSAPAEVKISPVLSNDSSSLFFTQYDVHGGAIYSLTTAGFTIKRWLDLQPAEVPTGSLWVSGFEFAFAPGHDDLFALAGVVRDSVLPANTPCCLVVFDTISRSVKGSIGLGTFSGLTALPAGPVAPHGGLVALVYSAYDPAVVTWVAVVDPSTRRIVDSVAVPMPIPGVVEQAQSFVAAPGGRRIYILGWFGVYGYDLLTKQLIGFVNTSSSGMDFGAHLAVSPDGSRVYLTSVFEPTYGTPRPPTTVRVFDANLVEQEPLALVNQFGTRTPIFHDVLVSRDGALLYLLAGDRDFFGEGMDRVMVLNLRTREVTRVIPLGVYALAKLLLGHN
jgi:DNA-binding beta-propeller fold protein YncE